jgi:hypothetical protein
VPITLISWLEYSCSTCAVQFQSVRNKFQIQMSPCRNLSHTSIAQAYNRTTLVNNLSLVSRYSLATSSRVHLRTGLSWRSPHNAVHESLFFSCVEVRAVHGQHGNDLLRTERIFLSLANMTVTFICHRLRPITQGTAMRLSKDHTRYPNNIMPCWR